MSDIFTTHKRFGIFGAGESGKSTLAKKISLLLWQTEKRPTLVCDPISKSAWGSHAKVFTSEEPFWKYIYKARNCLIVVDDASVTINRDNELNGVFTVLRHNGHKLLVIGHDASNLLPQMRGQLQRIFLFLQNEESVKKWESVFPGKDLLPATRLKQYQFLTTANYYSIEIFNLTK